MAGPELPEPEGQQMPLPPRGPTLADQFKTAREKLQADLRRIERAEQILKDKPELQELCETMSHIVKREKIPVYRSPEAVQ